MINVFGSSFLLNWASASYLIDVIGSRVCCLHYGGRISEEDIEALKPDLSVLPGRSIAPSGEKPLSFLPLEFSFPFRGDCLDPSFEGEKEGKAFDFAYSGYRLNKTPESVFPYPLPRGGEELVIELKDEERQVVCELHYIVYEEGLLRYSKIICLQGEMSVDRLASFTLDLPYAHQKGLFLASSWGDEAKKEVFDLPLGKIEAKSPLGSSCDGFNPFFALLSDNCDELFGEAYGFNLIYSGSFASSFSRDSFSRLRIQSGLVGGLGWKIKEGEGFASPLALLTYSDRGLKGLRKANKDFIESHITPLPFAKKPRPVSFNNWEATYFDFSASKIRSLADKAAKLGIELFVLDDGWFGKREDDTSSLGDWQENRKKVRGGIRKLSDYVHKKGMKFGLWFEPEMVSSDSFLFNEHPEYAFSFRGEKAVGRNQLVLDLTNKEVGEYLFGVLDKAIDEFALDYIKWDFNRPLSDVDAASMHSYVLSLYTLLHRLTKSHPDVLFENCASGGSRFDLGMLSFFPYGWVSDDTDSFERARIQSSLTLGYPLSTFSNHVSAKTSHQLFRKTSLGSKFDVACLGCLGYELDLSALNGFDEKEIKSQIEFYKAHREACQFGEVADLSRNGDFILLSSLESESILSYCVSRVSPSPKQERLRIPGLGKETKYKVSVRPEKLDLLSFGSMVNHISPVRIKEEGCLIKLIAKFYQLPIEEFSVIQSGLSLQNAGLFLGQRWAGNGISKQTRILFDFSARCYLIEKISED